MNSAASAVGAEARALGVDAIAIQATFRNSPKAERLVQETVEHFKRIDFLIGNAGIWKGAAIESMPEELWDRTMDINLKGTWSVCRGGAGDEETNFGRIVIVSSTAGQRGDGVLFQLRRIQRRSDRVYEVAFIGARPFGHQRQFGRARMGYTDMTRRSSGRHEPGID